MWTRTVWIRLGVASALGLLAAVAALQYLAVSFAEFHSSGWYSESSAAAAATGILVQRPVLVDSAIPLRTGDVRVVDAWIEEQTKVERRLFFWQRRVHTGAYRLIIHANLPHFAEGAATLATVSGPDTVPMLGGSSASGRKVFVRLQRLPLPDTLALSWTGGSP
jgi:hypothetical protein